MALTILVGVEAGAKRFEEAEIQSYGHCSQYGHRDFSGGAGLH